MRVATSGRECPSTSKSWLIANQAIAANGTFTIGPFALPGAIMGSTVLLCSADVDLPATAGGAHANLKAVITSDNNAIIMIDNPSAGALVALGANVNINVIALPLNP